MSRCCLKVDVDTHQGMRDGVPRLLERLRARGVRATFFLSFGPDNSGRAILNLVRRRGFLRKMLRSGAPRLYGWRTLLSGTLLPARPIAAAMPDLVRRIDAEGHEVGVHAWDHRLWQDWLDRLSRARVEQELSRACDAYARILGRPPRALAAPAWYATRTSLAVQDGLGLLYASDARGGAPAYPVLEGYRATTLQVPTTQPCLEELWALGERSPQRCLSRVLAPAPGATARVLPLHAEVEGGRHVELLDALLDRIQDAGLRCVTLEEVARDALAAGAPTRAAHLGALEGRPGRVLCLA